MTSFTDQNPKPQATWLLVLITSMSALALAIITPSLPGIGESFSVTPESAQRVLTVYMVMVGLGQLIFGPVSDRFGRRLTLLAGLGLYLLGSVLASFAPNLELLVLARFIQGLGASAAMVLPRVIINDTHQPRAAAASLAAVTAAMAITPMISFPLGGILFEFFGWRGSMVVAAFLGVVTIVSALFLLQETNNARQTSLRLASVAVDYLSLTKNKQFLLFSMNMGFHTSIFYAFLNFLPFAFKHLGYSASEFGYYIMLLPTSFIAGNLISRKLTPMLGITKMVRMGSLIIVAGVGTMAGYAMDGDFYRLYDINPLVEKMSSDEVHQFTFRMNAVKVRNAIVDVKLGDARLTMEQELKRGEAQNYDVLILDAFSSDSIPVHLLTKESMELYVKHMNPEGVIAVHISNRYLDLEPVVRRLAKEIHYPMVVAECYSGEDYGEDWIFACTWILLTRNEGIIQQLEEYGHVRSDLSRQEDLPLWTDDYASIFRIMNKPEWWPSWLSGDSR